MSVTPLSAFILDENGKLKLDSIKISTAAWVSGKILDPKFDIDKLENFLSFNMDTARITQMIASQCGEINDEGIVSFNNQHPNTVFDLEQPTQEIKLNLANITKLTKIIAEALNIKDEFLLKAPDICIRKIVRDKLPEKNTKHHPKPRLPDYLIPKLEMYDSCFIEEIMLVQKEIPNFYANNSAIKQYLGGESEPVAKDILNNKEYLQELLTPRIMSYARWPFNPAESLAALQNASINNILNTHEQEKIFAVNGPPGTGKTRLLFDLIANLYTKRAYELAKLESPDMGFMKETMEYKAGGFLYQIKDIVSSLSNYSMVIASSNNKAVENITQELPSKSKIYSEYLSQISLFEPIVKDNNNNWGIFSAILGNNDNINKFVKSVWKSEFPKSEEIYLNNGLLQYFELLKGNKKAQTEKLLELLPDYLKQYSPDEPLDDKLRKFLEKKEECNKKEWEKRREDFNNLFKEIESLYLLIDKIVILNNQKKEAQEIFIKQYGVNKDVAQNKLLDQINLDTSKIEKINGQIQYNESKLQRNLGLLGFVHKLFNTKKYIDFFNEREDLIAAKVDLLSEQHNLTNKIINLKQEIASFDSFLSQMQEIEKQLQPLCEEIKSQGIDVDAIIHSSYWTQDDKNMHETVPYHDKALEEKKNQLFIQALKLHEVFISTNAHHFSYVFKLFINIIEGKEGPKYEILKAIWNNIFMIIPVISTTFHSFGKMFKGLKHNDIKWLMIDEAGQSSPQCAVGSIYRSQNIVVVGDPMQTTPISNVGESLIENLFKKYDINPDEWSSYEVSVQKIADRNSLYQTTYGNVKVGFPLIVHRRCQEPMFKICNTISYDNKMISGLGLSPVPSPLTKILKYSRWIDVIAPNTASNDYKSCEECKALLKMIRAVLESHEGPKLLMQIYIISFYKNVKSNIKNMLFKELVGQYSYELIKNFYDNNVGTIHAFQGKEADSVIIVLGEQDPHNASRRNIMVDTPNVLNVGVSRAKNNLYIIGNKALWRKHHYMEKIQDILYDYAVENNFL